MAITCWAHPLGNETSQTRNSMLQLALTSTIVTCQLHAVLANALDGSPDNSLFGLCGPLPAGESTSSEYACGLTSDQPRIRESLHGDITRRKLRATITR